MNDIIITKAELAMAFEEGYQYAIETLKQKGIIKNEESSNYKLNNESSNQSGNQTNATSFDL